MCYFLRKVGTLKKPDVLGRIIVPPKDIHILIPGTLDYIAKGVRTVDGNKAVMS